MSNYIKIGSTNYEEISTILKINTNTNTLVYIMLDLFQNPSKCTLYLNTVYDPLEIGFNGKIYKGKEQLRELYIDVENYNISNAIEELE